jgi:hypothetical protein
LPCLLVESILNPMGPVSKIDGMACVVVLGVHYSSDLKLGNGTHLIIAKHDWTQVDPLFREKFEIFECVTDVFNFSYGPSLPLTVCVTMLDSSR